jgi:hypothetical protein
MPIHAKAVDITKATATILTWVSDPAVIIVLLMALLRCFQVASSGVRFV